MKLKVSTHDGELFEITVEEYNAVDLNEQLNNNEINTVVIGNIVISRINVKSVVPIQEEAVAE